MADQDSKPNRYEQRQDERRERYEELADKARREADAAFDQSRRMADVIPFGQPILIGHHSEKRDRNYRARISAKMDKACELSRKADHYAGKADAVGTGGISSDDPDAITKLQAELAKLEHLHSGMVKVNKAHKQFLKDPATLDASDLSDEVKARIRNYTPRYSWEPHPFAPYQLTNNGANIRRIRGRIEQLQQRPTESSESQVQAAAVPDGVTLREDATENRVMLIFPGKPPEAVREILKRSGFKWSPTRGAWVRLLNDAGKAAAQYVVSKLAEWQ